ncbi:hypothetical protein [Marinobacter caseinilyticus]|uniref:hypothetical protein n=1 Tax=Marinobacter caseinilyticus TaxID=2692195 RepID=UPI00140E8637|nr:hypothetical protein [Marinobacter caseinilyticus]
MLRAFIVVAVMVALLALAVLGPKWLMSSSGSDPGTVPTCELLTQGCEWSGPQGEWQAELVRLAADAGGDRLQLTIETSAQPGRLAAVLRGETMYLGEYPVPLRASRGNHRWQAVFTAPFCSVDANMTWRLDLLSDGVPVTSVPYTLAFNASGKR